MASAACVLVVDDDPAIRHMLSDYLTSEGYCVAVAADGESMRREIEQATPDLVLLDLKLPREDGLSLARFLRERYDVGIIMVTGASGVVDRIVGLEVGADDYVAKPFDPRELLATSRACCAGCSRVRRRVVVTHRRGARCRSGRARSICHRTSSAAPTARRSRSRPWSSTR